MKIGRLLDGILRQTTRLNLLMEILAEIGACLLAVVVIWGVVLTYGFEKSDIFSVELSEYLLIFICFASIAWVLKEDRHVRVEVFIERLSPRNRRVMDLATSILSLGFCLALTWKAFSVMLFNFQRGFRSASLLNFPLWIPYMIITLGAFLLSLQYIALIRELAGRMKRSPEPTEQN